METIMKYLMFVALLLPLSASAQEELVFQLPMSNVSCVKLMDTGKTYRAKLLLPQQCTMYHMTDLQPNPGCEAGGVTAFVDTANNDIFFPNIKLPTGNIVVHVTGNMKDMHVKTIDTYQP